MRAKLFACVVQPGVPISTLLVFARLGLREGANPRFMPFRKRGNLRRFYNDPLVMLIVIKHIYT